MLFVTILAFGLWRGLPFTEILMVAISQMVSMVPEGLPVAMTIALAVGMQRMAARGAIVRRLAAVETLGSTTVICSDKTGTLTRNEMTVTAAWLPDGRTLEITGAGYSPEGKVLAGEREITASDDAAFRALLEAAALCNDAQLVPPDDADSRWRPLGDPTEAALAHPRAQRLRGPRRAAPSAAAPRGNPVRFRAENDGHAARSLPAWARVHQGRARSGCRALCERTARGRS